MSTKYRYITDTGAISADTADLKAEIEAEYRNALGASLDTSASTSQGTLIAGETISRSDVMKNNAELANMTNPNLAYGTFLDAICSLLGVSRGTNQSTIATGVKILGDAGTTIPINSRVRTADGDVFLTARQVVIPAGGEALVGVSSQEFGPVDLPIGPLTIIDGTIGWGGAEVNVATSVKPGALALKDPALKNKRSQQLFKLGTGSVGSIVAAALDVPNVTSVNVVENNTGAAGLVNGITFNLPNAIWVCVAGNPDESEVAQALYDSHNGGIPWDFGSTGNGTPVNAPNGVDATDPSTGLIYRVKYTKPAILDCYVHVVVQQATSATSPGPAIQTAMMEYATGQQEGELGFVVGASVSAFELTGSVSRKLPGLFIRSCMVATVPTGSAAPAYPGDYTILETLNPFEQAVLQTGNITVEVI